MGALVAVADPGARFHLLETAAEDGHRGDLFLAATIWTDAARSAREIVPGTALAPPGCPGAFYYSAPFPFIKETLSASFLFYQTYYSKNTAQAMTVVQSPSLWPSAD